MLYIFLSILLTVSIIFNVFLLVCLKRSFFQIDTLESWVVDIKYLINNTYNKLKNIDDRNIFEKDDDVGIIFTDIKNLIKYLNIKVQENDDIGQEKK